MKSILILKKAVCSFPKKNGDDLHLLQLFTTDSVDDV
jgi:hypothetical protein